MERFNPSCTPFSTYLGLLFADHASAVVNIDNFLSIELPLAPNSKWYRNRGVQLIFTSLCRHNGHNRPRYTGWTNMPIPPKAQVVHLRPFSNNSKLENLIRLNNFILELLLKHGWNPFFIKLLPMVNILLGDINYG